MDIYGAFLDVHSATPYSIQQLIAIKHSIWIAHEQLQKPVFRRPSVNFLAVDGNAVTVKVELNAVTF